MAFDYDAGKPIKLKKYELAVLEEKFSSLVDELVNGEGKIKSNIRRIDFSPDFKADGAGGNEIEMVIRFRKQSESSWDIDDEENN